MLHVTHLLHILYWIKICTPAYWCHFLYLFYLSGFHHCSPLSNTAWYLPALPTVNDLIVSESEILIMIRHFPIVRECERQDGKVFQPVQLYLSWPRTPGLLVYCVKTLLRPIEYYFAHCTVIQFESNPTYSICIHTYERYVISTAGIYICKDYDNALLPICPP